MAGLNDILAAARGVPGHRPVPRAVVDAAVWDYAIDQLAGGQWALLGLWGAPGQVHMALLDQEADSIGVISLDCPDGGFPSVGRRHPPAQRLERAIRDLFGLEPVGAIDSRPWLDHGHRAPSPSPTTSAEASTIERYAFLAAEGEGLHHIPVGPVHAGIIEPGHFRLTVNGELVVRLEARLGFTHKGTLGLMTGAALADAARLAGRISGDSTVAHALAFARAAEAALGIEVPGRAAWLRALMAEVERLANHLGDIGAICNDAAFALMHAHCAILRERVLRAAEAAFGHRLMMDRVIPGGVAGDLAGQGIQALRGLVKRIGERFPDLVALYDKTSSLQARTVGAGVLSPALARKFAAGGYVGRASGRSFDARRMPGYPPYDELDFETPVRVEGDVNARIWVRIRDVEQSLALIDQILDRLPDGAIYRDLEAGHPGGVTEGLALVEGFRGDILAWLRLGDDGRVAACHLRDPSWFQWPLLEAAIEGNIVADFPLCNKSFNCSYSGVDL